MAVLVSRLSSVHKYTPMEAKLCAKEEVILVGGGNSAGQAATFLSRFAAHIHMLVRGNGLAVWVPAI